jgi:hypothetical protein
MVYTQKKRRENIYVPETGQKRGWQEDWLIAATKAQPFISRRPVSTTQLISLVLVCPQVHDLICQLLHHFSSLNDCVSSRRG